jgi:hypothetical protein
VVLILLIVGLILLMKRRKKAREAELAVQEQKIASLADQSQQAESRLADLDDLRKKEEALRKKAEQEVRAQEAEKELERIRKEMYSAGKSPRLSVFLNEGSEVISLPGPVVVLGRAADADISVEHNTISRHHAQIIYEGGIYHLRDLGSTNGTFHNGDRVEEATLKHGDTISLGEVRIMFYI